MLGVGLSLMSVAIRGRAADIPPVISITSGSGYAGSVLTSTQAGQWYADDVAIPGQTGLTYTLPPEFEGSAIRCGNSNTIQTPTDFVTVTRLGEIVTHHSENVMRAA